jgi:hypothetical protein
VMASACRCCSWICHRHGPLLCFSPENGVRYISYRRPRSPAGIHSRYFQ